jgi:hypothetical protein
VAATKPGKKARADALSFLNTIFGSVDADKISAMLLENQGNVDACVEQLIEVVLRQESQLSESDKQRLRREQKELDEVRAIAVRLDEEERLASLKAAVQHQSEQAAALLTDSQHIKQERVQPLEAKRKLSEAETLAIVKYELERKIRTPALPPQGPQPPANTPVERKKMLGELDIKEDQLQAVVSFPEELKTVSQSQEADLDGFELVDATPEMQSGAFTINAVLDWKVADRYALRVSFKQPETATSSDWVGMFVSPLADNPILPDPKESIQWQYASKASTLPTQPDHRELTFRTPSRVKTGFVMFCYYAKLDGDFYCTATSQRVAVGPEFSFGVTQTTKTDAHAFGSIVATVTQTAGLPCGKSWVGFYKGTDTSVPYRFYKYLSRGVDGADGSKTITFHAPSAGIWTAVLYPFKTYAAFQTQQVTLLGQDAVTAISRDQGKVSVTVQLDTLEPKLDKVWVGLYLVGEARPNYYRRYQYLTAQGSDVVTFKEPKKPGQYEARLFRSDQGGVLRLVNHTDFITID